MTNSEENFLFYRGRPILLLSNSCWYLNHYRNCLINEIQKNNLKLIVMAPYDNTSIELSSKVFYIPWRVSRNKNFNLIVLFIAFLRLFFQIRALKPGIIHSHTLKPNLLASIVSSLFGIPLVISFAGLGRLSTMSGSNTIFLKIVLKLITFFSKIERYSRWKWKYNYQRTTMIFQNPGDLDLFRKIVGSSSKSLNLKLIYGSGVPKDYIDSSINLLSFGHNFKNKKINIVYCARLLKSKGIEIFISLAKHFPNINFNVYGEIDPFSNDSLTLEEVEKIKLEKNVIYHGFKKNPLLNHLKTPTILIVPSFYGEGLPRSIPEAMVLRIPVIASLKACCGIFNKTHLYQAYSNDNTHYIKLLKKIINNFGKEEFINKLNISRDYAKENFSEEYIVNTTFDIYRQFYDTNLIPYFISRYKI